MRVKIKELDDKMVVEDLDTGEAQTNVKGIGITNFPDGRQTVSITYEVDDVNVKLERKQR